MDARRVALIRRAWPRQLIFLLLMAALLFVPAGTLHYWQGWLFLAVFVASTLTIGIYFLHHDPALIERRMSAGPGAEQEPAQKAIITLISCGFVLLLVIPALDRRWHWSALPPWVVGLANAGIVLGFVIFFFVMKQNTYAAATVRVEAGQPRSFPRASTRSCVLLVVPLLAMLIWRLADEERYLSANLPGYQEYCRRTRWRLLPFIW
ncbi:MAG TPA: isoprenylcysteine carboxylmethyltransferase family protein [Pseudolabrys sp.]|nr:isoprenylcysteine carboxylmethyltransferase family protein [Pseudolabrys sp.]